MRSTAAVAFLEARQKINMKIWNMREGEGGKCLFGNSFVIFLILSPSSHHLQIVRETCCLSLIDRRAKLNLIRLSANLQQIYNVDSTLKMSPHSCILLCNGFESCFNFFPDFNFWILQFSTCICFFSQDFNFQFCRSVSAKIDIEIRRKFNII